ncbi:MAG: hypothetical protein LC775_17050 [Acidobacteria bacterium]|nr:hypothetical protein [Acidobacteriota bacterium]
MKPSDFFVEDEDPAWDLRDRAAWESMGQVFNSSLVERLRRAPQDDIDDVDAAYGLAKLTHEELRKFGTSNSNLRLNDEELTTALRSLRSVLKRVGIEFDPPFRDFNGFHGYWSSHDMSGSWAARRGYLNDLFSPIYSCLDRLEDERSETSSVRGVDGELKNLIFASTGPKPEIVLRDAINNVIEVTKNAEYCLFYDRPLAKAGLTWGALVEWWQATRHFDGMPGEEVARNLYGRLSESVKHNPAERLVLRTYCERYRSEEASTLPALLPQVYLHYDPLTRQQRGGRPSVLVRERMDFLLLLPGQVRIVLEVDGKQHYAQGDTASPRLYAEMVAADRGLRLRGYDVYRFGGFELSQPGAEELLRQFFDTLLSKYAG